MPSNFPNSVRLLRTRENSIAVQRWGEKTSAQQQWNKFGRRLLSTMRNCFSSMTIVFGVNFGSWFQTEHPIKHNPTEHTIILNNNTSCKIPDTLLCLWYGVAKRAVADCWEIKPKSMYKSRQRTLYFCSHTNFGCFRPRWDDWGEMVGKRGNSNFSRNCGNTKKICRTQTNSSWLVSTDVLLCLIKKISSPGQMNHGTLAH